MSDEGWGGGEVAPVEPEAFTELDVLRAIGVQLRVQNEHLSRLRAYCGLAALAACLLLLITVLFLAGAFTLEFRPLR